MAKKFHVCVSFHELYMCAGNLKHILNQQLRIFMSLCESKCINGAFT